MLAVRFACDGAVGPRRSAQHQRRDQVFCATAITSAILEAASSCMAGMAF